MTKLEHAAHRHTTRKSNIVYDYADKAQTDRFSFIRLAKAPKILIECITLPLHLCRKVQTPLQQ